MRLHDSHFHEKNEKILIICKSLRFKTCRRSLRCQLLYSG
jgi:hypothetical protein